MSIGLITSPSSWSFGTVVPSTWLQNVQDNINGLIGGTGPTLKALQVDGVGGNASTQPTGTIGVSATGAFGTSTPTPTIAVGNIYKELIPFSYGYYTCTAGASPTISLLGGFNVSSITRSGTGVHSVNFVTSATNGANAIVVAGASQPGVTQLTVYGLGGNNTACAIGFNNSSGANTDPTAALTRITFVVYGI